jgi:hypothetical protein
VNCASAPGKQFVEEGGCSELLAVKRMPHRVAGKKDQSDRFGLPDHILNWLLYGKPVVPRIAKSGKSEGRQFRGCTACPDCRGGMNF